MSIFIFFGMALVILLVGVTYVTLTIRHHWGRGQNSDSKTASGHPPAGDKKP